MGSSSFRKAPIFFLTLCTKCLCSCDFIVIKILNSFCFWHCCYFAITKKFRILLTVLNHCYINHLIILMWIQICKQAAVFFSTDCAPHELIHPNQLSACCYLSHYKLVNLLVDFMSDPNIWVLSHYTMVRYVTIHDAGSPAVLVTDAVQRTCVLFSNINKQLFGFFKRQFLLLESCE